MKLKRIFLLLLVIPFILSVSSCWNLGNYESPKAYTDSFEVFIVDDLGTHNDFDMEDFYNDDSVNYILPEDFEAKPYKYLALKVTADEIKVGNIAMSLLCTTDGSVDVEVSVVSHMPTNPKNLDKDLQKLKDYIAAKKTDPNATLTFDTNDDPEYLARTSLNAKANVFDEIIFVTYKDHGDSIVVKKNEYILFEFTNNTDSGIELKDTMTEQEATELITNRRKFKKNIAFTNFLIESK